MELLLRLELAVPDTRVRLHPKFCGFHLLWQNVKQVSHCPLRYDRSEAAALAEAVLLATKRIVLTEALRQARAAKSWKMAEKLFPFSPPVGHKGC